MNVVGGQSPFLLQPLPCEWNYHTWQCRPDRTERSPISRMRPGVNLCPGARSGGVALLHGNCQVGGPPPPLGLRRLRRSTGLRLPVLGGAGEGGGLEGAGPGHLDTWGGRAGAHGQDCLCCTEVTMSSSPHHSPNPKQSVFLLLIKYGFLQLDGDSFPCLR